MDYIIALLLFFLTIISISFIKGMFVRTLENIYEKKHYGFLKIGISFIYSIKRYFYWAIYFYVPLKFLNLSPTTDVFIDRILTVVVFVQLISVAISTYRYFWNKYVVSKKEYDENTYGTIEYVLEGTIRLLGGLWVLSNVGIDITPFIASLGVSGLAVAFAARAILENIFATFMIYLDKSMKVGDYVQIGGDKGVVKFIGLRSTKIQDSTGNLLIVPNKEFVNTRLYNSTQIEKRRIVFSMKVDYAISLEQAKSIVQDLKDILSGTERIGSPRVNLRGVTGGGLEYEIAYFINIERYRDFMSKQEEINFKFLEYFKTKEIKLV